MQKRFRFVIVIFAAAALAIAAGCSSKQATDASKPVVSTVGAIDMAKVIRSHPKYPELDRLTKELNTLSAEIEQRAAMHQTEAQTMASGSADQGLTTALEQEFNAKMAQKQDEIEKRLNEKANQVRGELTADLRSYAAEVEQEYQPKIFSLQLKLKTVQLAKEEAEKVQQELEDLQAERNRKLAAKEQELSASLETRMRPAQQAAEQEMAAYARELHERSRETYEAKSSEIAGRVGQPPASEQALLMLERQAAMKRQEIGALEEHIIKDIRDKTAKIAAERKLDTVLANVRLNVQAIDVSDLVISEIKK